MNMPVRYPHKHAQAYAGIVFMRTGVIVAVERTRRTPEDVKAS